MAQPSASSLVAQPSHDSPSGSPPDSAANARSAATDDTDHRVLVADMIRMSSSLRRSATWRTRVPAGLRQGQLYHPPIGGRSDEPVTHVGSGGRLTPSSDGDVGGTLLATGSRFGTDARTVRRWRLVGQGLRVEARTDLLPAREAVFVSYRRAVAVNQVADGVTYLDAVTLDAVDGPGELAGRRGRRLWGSPRTGSHALGGDR